MPLDPTEVLARLDWERRHVPLGGETLERAEPVVRMWAPDGSHHVIIWSDLSPQNANEIIAREIAHHEALRVSFEWKVYSHDLPADLKDRLAAFGFEVGPVENVLVMSVDELPAPEANRRDIRVDTVRTEEQVAVFKRLAEGVFGGDWSFTARELQSQIDRGLTGHRGYIAYLDDEPAAMGRLYVHPESHFAGLYGGGTLPKFRGRGAYRATVRARMLDAARFGARYLLVDARDTSRPILERMGFVSLARTWPCVME
jgi:acetyltransferase (GNAT) family protein